MKETNKPSLLILCPCFNEMQTIESSIDTLLQTLADLGEKDLINYSLSRILVVDDGSSDESWSILKNINAIHAVNKSYNIIKTYRRKQRSHPNHIRGIQVLVRYAIKNLRYNLKFLTSMVYKVMIN